MQVIEDINELLSQIKLLNRQVKSIGFIPTMGYLHQGHISLVEKSKSMADITVVSVFVNPSQFNDPKDLELYPRDFKRDCEQLSSAQADIVFAPKVEQIYKPDFQTSVAVDQLSVLHEGEFRAGHFKGVTTVVNILFNLVKPDFAFFGEKDFQQLAIIRKMVSDLKINTEIVGCPIVREADGLALSSRNVRLNQPTRIAAPKIFEALQSLQKQFSAGERDCSKLIQAASSLLADSAFSVEYLRIINPVSLDIKSEATKGDRVILAAHLGGVRLIDNIALT